MNQAVNQIVKHCLANKIGNMVVGEPKEIKQNIKLGKKNNQNFVNIPFGLFKQKLRSKCQYYGINCVETDEAYTSQKCSVCGIVDKNNRKHRGLYVCKNCGTALNADVNGGINILKKVAPKSLTAGIGSSGGVNQPVRIRIPKVLENQTSHEAPSERGGSSLAHS